VYIASACTVIVQNDTSLWFSGYNSCKTAPAVEKVRAHAKSDAHFLYSEAEVL
jgi:hypothetical protein